MGFIKFFLKFILAVTVLVVGLGWYFYYQSQQHDPVELNPLVVNDITGLNPVSVASLIKPQSQQDILDAILVSNGPISIGGARYSMGGQISFPDSLHIDMRDYDEIIKFDAENKLITVQTGITWRAIQEFIDEYDLSIKIMQDFNNFTVGGSLSVNAHGRYLHAGPIINSVRSIKIALANGTVYEASPEKNNALFYGAIGGYGALGVITEATLELVDNVALELTANRMEFTEYLKFFKANILNDDKVVMHNALLYPPTYESLIDLCWRKTEKPVTNDKRLRDTLDNTWWKPVLTELISKSSFLQRIRKNLIDPQRYNKTSVLWRNYEASQDLHEYGFANSSATTLSLHEYFVPLDSFEVFVLKMRDIFLRHEVNVLNISIRYTPKDSKTLLSWARKDMLSFIVVYLQGKNEESIQQVEAWSKELIQGAIESGGSYYMPFQIHETTAQFYKAYPGADYFFQLKQKADPDNRFNNMLWLEHYAKNKVIKETLAIKEALAIKDALTNVQHKESPGSGLNGLDENSPENSPKNSPEQ